MKAKLVKESINKNEKLNEVIHWPAMIMGLFFLYRFIKGYLNKPSHEKTIEELEQEIIEGLAKNIKTAIEEKRHILYSENILYHIFEINNDIIKLNKQDRTVLYALRLHRFHEKEFTKFPIKLTEKQYNDFLHLIEEN